MICLRRTFVGVHVCDDASIIDGHKHFVEAGGWREHAMFVKCLRSPKKADACPWRSGPASRPGSGRESSDTRSRNCLLCFGQCFVLRHHKPQHPRGNPASSVIVTEREMMMRRARCVPSPWTVCVSTRADGKRCTTQRLVGGHCRQHEKLLGAAEGMLQRACCNRKVHSKLGSKCCPRLVFGCGLTTRRSPVCRGLPSLIGGRCEAPRQGSAEQRDLGCSLEATWVATCAHSSFGGLPICCRRPDSRSWANLCARRLAITWIATGRYSHDFSM